jgi:hypothetical protein
VLWQAFAGCGKSNRVVGWSKIPRYGQTEVVSTGREIALPGVGIPRGAWAVLEGAGAGPAADGCAGVAIGAGP